MFFGTSGFGIVNCGACLVEVYDYCVLRLLRLSRSPRPHEDLDVRKLKKSPKVHVALYTWVPKQLYGNPFGP